MKRHRHLFWIVALAALSLLASRLAYEDALEDERIYCERVAEGVWPPYRGDKFCDQGE